MPSEYICIKHQFSQYQQKASVGLMHVLEWKAYFKASSLNVEFVISSVPILQIISIVLNRKVFHINNWVKWDKVFFCNFYFLSKFVQKNEISKH